MKEEENKDQQNHESNQGNRLEVVSSKSFFPSLTSYSTVNNIRHYLRPIVTKLAGYSSSIFHPPSMV